MSDPLSVSSVEALISEWRVFAEQAKSNAENERVSALDRRQCYGAWQAATKFADELRALLEARTPQQTEATPKAELLDWLQYEDDLPADMTKAEYDFWYARSWVPDGVGVRVGPKFTRPAPPPSSDRGTR